MDCYLLRKFCEKFPAKNVLNVVIVCLFSVFQITMAVCAALVRNQKCCIGVVAIERGSNLATADAPQCTQIQYSTRDNNVNSKSNL